MFKLWSEIKKEAKDELSPNFGFRIWVDLTSDDKYKIWKYLEWHFFEKDEKNKMFYYCGNRKCNYKFFGDIEEQSDKLTRVTHSVHLLNMNNKASTPSSIK